MGNLEHALSAFENALRHNPNSLPGLIQVAGIARIKEDYQKVRRTLGPAIPSRSFSWYLRNRPHPGDRLFPARGRATERQRGSVELPRFVYFSLHITPAL